MVVSADGVVCDAIPKGWTCTPAYWVITRIGSEWFGLVKDQNEDKLDKVKNVRVQSFVLPSGRVSAYRVLQSPDHERMIFVMLTISKL